MAIGYVYVHRKPILHVYIWFYTSCDVKVPSKYKRMYGPKSTSNDSFSVNIEINEIALASYVVGVLLDLL